ncbi:MAG: RES family NAD+ phosphorylase [Bdellovibrionaceae bacterium]|nr:RES family NAD+ phosphorylase [Pseudobdellovibrionaceae bacterium]
MISIYLFDDPFLDDLFKKEAVFNICDISGRTEECIDENILLEYFDNLLPLYIPYHREAASAVFEGGSSLDDGSMVWEAIEQDFGVFNPTNDQSDNEAIFEILYGKSEYFDNPVYKYHESYETDDIRSYEYEYWEAFKQEIRHENRFFPKNTLDFSKFEELIEYRKMQINKGEYFYRARKSSTLLDSDQMGAPPKELSTEGRANPRGIPYLYLGKNEKICRKEIKTQSSCSIGLFELTQNIKVVDFSNHYITSPFYFGNKISSYVGSIEILKMYINEMSKPADPDHAYLDYLPTQYICERMKKSDYDGILFKSSFAQNNSDLNLTLFKTDVAICKSVSFHSAIE